MARPSLTHVTCKKCGISKEKEIAWEYFHRNTVFMVDKIVFYYRNMCKKCRNGNKGRI